MFPTLPEMFIIILVFLHYTICLLLKLRKVILEKMLCYQLIYQLFCVMQDPEQNAQTLGSVGIDRGGKGEEQEDMEEMEPCGYGKLYLRWEERRVLRGMEGQKSSSYIVQMVFNERLTSKYGDRNKGSNRGCWGPRHQQQQEAIVPYDHREDRVLQEPTKSPSIGAILVEGPGTVHQVTQRKEGEKKKYLGSLLYPLTSCRKLKLVKSNHNQQGNPSDVIQKSQLPEAETWVEKGREWIWTRDKWRITSTHKEENQPPNTCEIQNRITPHLPITSLQ